jgi:Protein of unknown function (DUF2586)
MARIPNQKLTVHDPGLPLSPPSLNSSLMLGCCEKGEVGKLYAFSRVADAIRDLGQGPLSECVCTTLAHPGAGGPVYAVPLAQSVLFDAAAASPNGATVVPTRVGTSLGTITVTGHPFDAYDVVVETMVTGTRGTAEYVYSLDGGRSRSPQLPVPAGGAADLPQTGLTIKFNGTGALGVHVAVMDDSDPPVDTAIDFEIGDVHRFLCRAPHYSGLEFGVGLAAAKAGGGQYAVIVATGECKTADIGALVNATIGGHIATMFDEYRFARGVCTPGGPTDDEDAVGTAYADFVHERTNVVFGHCWQASAKPIQGWQYPKRPLSDLVAARAMAVAISTSLARYASGPLSEVVKLEHNEALSERMDQQRFTTARTHIGVPGFYITQGRLMAPLGSDYEFWHAGRVMDVACATVYRSQLPFLGASVRVNPDGSGTIDERDATRLEEPVRDSLSVALMDPDNAEGTQGHVSEVEYTIDRTTNVVTSRTLYTSVALIPLGYTDYIITELGFTLG